MNAQKLVELGARIADRRADDLCTPIWILDLVRAMGPIALDPCSNPWSMVGAEVSYSARRGVDGLATPWDFVLRTLEIQGSIFVNPPYSKPGPWCDAARDAARAGRQVFVLSKLDPSTQWSATLRGVASARVDFYKRISFDGGAHKTGMFPSTLVYCGAFPLEFVDLFAPHGDARSAAR